MSFVKFYTIPIVTLLFILINHTLFAQNCGISNNIGGTVFGDFNANGINDENLTELSGITVTAYDDNGVVVAQDVTNTKGKYLLLVSNGKRVRVEFTTLPDGMFPGFYGNDSGTSVQFITSPTCSADFGLMNYSSYCENNPRIVLPCYVSGNPLAGGNAGTADALVGFGYNQTGTSPSVDHIALAQQVGAVWGTAWDRKDEVIFTSSMIKRHSGFGPLGIGGIYMISNYPGAGTISNYINLSNCINVGSISRPDLPASTFVDNYDNNAYLQMGKMGLGNIAISEDGTTLWVVNLNSKTLVRIRIRANPDAPINTSPSCGDVTEFSIPSACGTEMRPWAVEWHNDLVYVGTVCSQSLSANTYTFDPVSESFSTSILSFSLVDGVDIDKGCVTFNEGCRWYSWTDSYPTSIQAYNLEVIYPQPIFSDIDFDAQGNMILSFIDRFGHQTGFNNYYRPGSQTRYSGNTGGDLYIAYNDNGTFVFEQNGNLVDGSGTVIRAGCGTGGTGGVEFFCQEDWQNVHRETALGASAVHRGRGHLVTSVYDPFDAFSGGAWWANLSSGQPFARNQLYSGAGFGFGKAAGLGEPSLLCGIAPIQIGNYVWQDDDKDGLQDPSEPPLSGVTVQLIDASGTVVATTTTDANGQYLFSSNSTPAITAFTDYYIVIPNPVIGSSGSNLTLTDANTTGSDINDSDATIITSGVPSNVQNLPAIAITTGNYGENNHSYDFGFSNCRLQIYYSFLDCDFLGGTTTNLQVIVQWTDLSVGDVLNIAVGGQSGNYTVFSPNGSNNFIFAGVAESGTISVTNQNDTNCTASETYQLPTYLTLDAVSTSNCVFNTTTFESMTTLSFDLSWTLLAAGDVITIEAGNQTQTITVAGNGSQNISFDFLADGSTNNPISISVDSNPCAVISGTYDLPPPCPECGLSAANVTIGECYEAAPGVYESELLVEASWIFANIGEQLNVSVDHLGGPSVQSTTISAISGTHIFTFVVPANGSVNNAITFSWTSGLNCTIANTTYNARPACLTRYDVALNKDVDVIVANPGDNVTFTVDIVNQGATTATGIEVTDALQAGLTYQSNVTTQGAYNALTNVWTVGTLVAGQSETLTFIAQVDAGAEGVYFNEAEVSLMTENDIDSTPDNDDPTEDDWDDACVTVPITLCGPETFRVEADIGLYSYQWYFDNGSGASPIPGATSSILIINAGAANSGTYYYEAYTEPSLTNLSQSCCPIIVDNSLCDCYLSITGISIPDCILDASGQSATDVVVEVDWAEVSLPDNLVVNVNGTQQTFPLNATSGNQNFIFSIPTDGSTITATASLGSGGTSPVTGNVQSIISTGGTVQNQSQAIGPITNEGLTASAANSMRLSGSNATATVQLEHTVPAGTPITLSVARDFNGAADFTVAIGGAALNITDAPQDVLRRYTITPTVDANTMTLTRNASAFWFDGAEYTINGGSSTCSDATTFTAPTQCTACDLSISGINVGDCVFPANEHSLEFTVNWTDANIGDVIEVFAGGGAQTHVVATTSGSHSFTFTGFATGIEEIIIAQINDVISCGTSTTYPSPDPCPPCELTLDYIEPGVCVLNGGNSESEVTVGFSWLYATDTPIEVIIDGQIFTYDTGGESSGTATLIATGLPADGASHNVTVRFANDTACSDSGTYTADDPCIPCTLQILNINNVGDCYYDTDTGESFNDISVTVQWTNALPGSSIKFLSIDPTAEPDTVTHYLFIEPLYSLAGGQATVEFSVPATGQPAILEAAMLPDYTCQATSTPYTAPEPCCNISIFDIKVNHCVAGQYSVDVTVSYSGVSTGGIDINGTVFPVASSSGSETFTLTGLTCNLATNQTITAQVVNEPDCNDSVTYDAPGPCTVTIDNIVIGECSIDKFSVDITYSYNNPPGNISINDCIIKPTGQSGTETFKLIGLPCGDGNAVTIEVKFVDDESCSDTEIIQSPCPKGRICIPGANGNN